MCAPPIVGLSILQFLPVSMVQRRWHVWLWQKEVSLPWCVSPVGFLLRVCPGEKTVNVWFNQWHILDRWCTKHWADNDKSGPHNAESRVFITDYELKSDQRVRVLSGGRQLQISSAERTDAASYTCTASSAAGTSSKEYSLQVYGMKSTLYHFIMISSF